MASSSACAVGSRRASVRLPARDIIAPSGPTITAPIGTSPRSRAASASARARSIGRLLGSVTSASFTFIMSGKVGGKGKGGQGPRKGKANAPGPKAFAPTTPATRMPAPRPPVARPQEPMRIAKAMAHAGLCSRRDAERWTEAGRVAVDGKVLTSPAHVVGPGDKIAVDGKPLPQAQALRVWRYHKPKGLV